MKIETCSFVRRSEIFDGLDKQWEIYSQHCRIPFGDAKNNNPSLRTMVTREDILDDYDNNANACFDAEMDTLRKRLDSLPDGTYIDLES